MATKTALELNTVCEVPVSSIVRGENIREEKKAQNTANIEESIKNIGVTTPLIVNQKMILVDGNRRLNTLLKLGIPTVKVLIQDIPEEEIPLFQYVSMQRTGISDKERARAILSYVSKNPAVTDTEVARKFAVDPSTVSNAVKIHKISPKLSGLVLDNKVTQNAAHLILETAGAKGTKKVTDKVKKQIESVATTLENEIESELISDDTEASNNTEEKTTKKFIPWDVRKINKTLTSLNQPGLKIEQPPKEPKQVPVKKQALSYIDYFLENLQFSPDPKIPGQLVINGGISTELWKEISNFVSLNHESTNSVKEERAIEDLLNYYQSHNLNGEVFIQDSQDTYVTFNAELASLYPSLKLQAIVENSLELIRVDAKSIEQIAGKLNSKGISTLLVRQTKFTTTSTSKKTATTTTTEQPQLQPESLTDDETELEGIPTVEAIDTVNTEAIETVEPEAKANEVIPEEIVLKPLELEKTNEPNELTIITQEEADARESLFGKDDPTLQTAVVEPAPQVEPATQKASKGKGKKSKPDLSKFLNDTTLVAATAEEEDIDLDEDLM